LQSTLTVGNADTVEQLASRMASSTASFRILNGLDAGDRLNPGDLVKIVVE
jgi:predicted Zn-dependent protease